jgi:hypothetical protein
MSLWSKINGHTTPIFVENRHEWPFSIIPKANTFRFLSKKWSPPEIQACDLWQWNICGVRCKSLWSMINGHTTPIFVENSHERPFSIIPKANTYRFLTKKRSPLEIQECDIWQENICGVRCRRIIDQRLVHLTPHMFPCHRSHSWISSGDHFLGKNPNVLAFGIIENCHSWLFSTKMGVVWPLIFD